MLRADATPTATVLGPAADRVLMHSCDEHTRAVVRLTRSAILTGTFFCYLQLRSLLPGYLLVSSANKLVRMVQSSGKGKSRRKEKENRP